MRTRRILAPLLAATLASSSAAAQQAGFALDRFDVAPAGDRLLGVPSPSVSGDRTLHLMLLADYAHDPLVLRSLPGEASLGAVVASQLVLHFNGGFALWHRLYLDVDVPVAVYQSGADPTVGGQMFLSPGKAQFGDLRLGARVRLWGEDADPFQIAVAGHVWLPTGASGTGTFVSDGRVRGKPEVVIGGRGGDRVVWSAALGVDVRAAQTFAGVGLGTMVTWGAGAGVLLLDDRRLQIGPEASGAVTVSDVRTATTNAELLLDVRYRFSDTFELGGGAGPALAGGIGTPDVRAVVMMAYTPEPARAREVIPVAKEKPAPVEETPAPVEE